MEMWRNGLIGQTVSYSSSHCDETTTQRHAHRQTDRQTNCSLTDHSKNFTTQ